MFANGTGRGINRHQAVFVVGDHQCAIRHDLHAVRLTIIFCNDGHIARGANLENAAPGDIDNVEIARSVKCWTFQEAINGRAVAIDNSPFRDLAGAAQIIRNASEHFGLDVDGFRERHLGAPGLRN